MGGHMLAHKLTGRTRWTTMYIGTIVRCFIYIYIYVYINR